MHETLPPANVGGPFRFGVFEFDEKTLELVKNGRAVSLRPQPLKLLALLLARPGELISRDSLQRALWGGDTFVDFEQGVNHAIRELRAVLGDSAESPRFIQTLPRRGYRFIAPVERVMPLDLRTPAPEGQEPPLTGVSVRRPHPNRLWIAAAIGVVVLISIVVVTQMRRADDVSPPFALGSLAVKPFSSPNDPALGIGLAKAISARLGGQQTVSVRSSDTGASHVIDGEIMIAGTDVTMFARLKDVARGATVWSDRVTVHADQLFSAASRRRGKSSDGVNVPRRRLAPRLR